jgi:hypothetical protein
MDKKDSLVLVSLVRARVPLSGQAGVRWFERQDFIPDVFGLALAIEGEPGGVGLAYICCFV